VQHQQSNKTVHRFMSFTDYIAVNTMSHMHREQISFTVGTANFNYITTHQ